MKAHFTRVYEDALPPMAGDASALGSLPTGAYQYCEAVRTASSMGWYMFPPKDTQLYFDGHETFVANGDAWEPLLSQHFEPEFMARWNAMAPASLQDRPPPFLATTFVPGIVQVWTGWLVQTEPDWFTHVRPIANADFSSAFSCFEGIVETDRFGPWPVFVNLRLHATQRAIPLLATKPLFQLQVLPAEAVAQRAQKARWSEAQDLPEAQWEGVAATIRNSDPREEPSRRPGQYAAASRKREKTTGRCPVAHDN